MESANSDERAVGEGTDQTLKLSHAIAKAIQKEGHDLTYRELFSALDTVWRGLMYEEIMEFLKDRQVFERIAGIHAPKEDE